MSGAELFTLILTIAASSLLVLEWLRPDLIAMILMVILGLSGIVPQKDIFSGFSSTAVITILGVSIISESLRQTGVTHWLGQMMSRFGKQTEWRTMLAVMLVSAGLSLFMNNIAAVGVLLPAVMTLSRQGRISPSMLLLPLAYGTTLGGMATLLTTSNIIVSGALRDAGYLPFGLLDFLPVGIPVVTVGILYMLLFGRRILARKIKTHKSEPEYQLRLELLNQYDLKRNLHLVAIQQGSPLAGQTIASANWAASTGLSILGVFRKNQFQYAPSPGEMILAGDQVLVQGNPQPAKLVSSGLQLIDNPHHPIAISDESTILAELVLAPHSGLVGKTISEIRFREKYHLNILAIWRNNRSIQKGLGQVSLKSGDALLVQGSTASIRLVRSEPDLVVLREDPDAILKPQKYRLALLITVLTLGVASLNILPVAPVVLAGAALVLLTNCLDMNDVYRAVEWRAVFLIAGMWPLSIAIRTTGLADLLVKVTSDIAGQIPPIAIAAILLGLSFLLSQFMGGQVASLVLAPLAISASQSTGVDVRSLAMSVALGCSLTFATPYGHPVNTIVMASGSYTFRDYFKIGLPLTILAFITILAGLKLFWNL
jgi:di/tricarboxylate transporter